MVTFTDFCRIDSKHTRNLHSYDLIVNFDREIILALGCPSIVEEYLDATHEIFNVASPRASNRDICAGIVVLNSHYSLIKKEQGNAEETNQQEDQADEGRSEWVVLQTDY